MNIDYLQIYFPLLCACLVFVLPQNENIFKNILMAMSVSLLLVNVMAVLSVNGNLNEFWSFLVIMNQEKSFDFFIYRTSFANLLVLSCSILLLITNIVTLNIKMKNSRIIYSLYFLLFWFSMIFFYADSLVLFVSCLEFIGILFLLVVLIEGSAEKKSLQKFSSFWVASSLFMFAGLSIIASVLGSAKGIYDITISSMPTLMNELGPFSNKSTALALIALSLSIKVGVFPFHGWILNLLKIRNPVLTSCLLFNLPHVLLNILARLFLDIAGYENLVFNIILVLCGSNLVLLLDYVFSRKKDESIAYLSVVSNCAIIAYSINLSFENIVDGYYVLLCFNLVCFIFYLSTIRSSGFNKTFTLLGSFCRKYILASMFLIPFSMIFISFYLMISKFSSSDSWMGLIVIGPLGIMMSLHSIDNKKEFLSYQSTSLSLGLPIVLMSLVLLLLGVFPGLLIGVK